MKSKLLISLLIFGVVLTTSCKNDSVESKSIAQETKSIGSDLKRKTTGSHNILDLYNGYSKSDFIPYVERSEESDRKLQENIYDKYVAFFNTHNVDILMPFDYILTQLDAKNLVYDDQKLGSIKMYNSILERNYLDSIQEIKNHYSKYITSDIEYRYDENLKKKVKNKTENRIIYKGDNIATETITHNYENDEKIERYKFESTGFDYDYFIKESYGSSDEKFSTLKLKPYKSPGKYPTIPNYTPFARMSDLSKDGSYHLYGNDNYEILISQNQIISFNIMSTLKGNHNCRQFIHLLDNEYKNGTLTQKNGDISEYNFRNGTYAKYRIWGESDTIFYETGKIKFDDICQSTNIEYEFNKIIESSKLYEMVSLEDFNYKKVLIEHKTYKEDGSLENHKTYYKDGSLKDNISF